MKSDSTGATQPPLTAAAASEQAEALRIQNAGVDDHQRGGNGTSSTLAAQ